MNNPSAHKTDTIGLKLSKKQDNNLFNKDFLFMA